MTVGSAGDGDCGRSMASGSGWCKRSGSGGFPGFGDGVADEGGAGVGVAGFGGFGLGGFGGSGGLGGSGGAGMTSALTVRGGLSGDSARERIGRVSATSAAITGRWVFINAEARELTHGRADSSVVMWGRDSGARSAGCGDHGKDQYGERVQRGFHARHIAAAHGVAGLRSPARCPAQESGVSAMSMSGGGEVAFLKSCQADS